MESILNRTLPTKRIIPLPGDGPEDVVADKDGRLIVGLKDGRILRIEPSSGAVQEIANTGGRPLGLEVLPSGLILVCNSPLGLLEVDPTVGHVRPLVKEADGRPLQFCSNVVAAADGTTYFSMSSARYTLDNWRKDVVEDIPTGALFRRSTDGRVDKLLDGLYFANGLALAPDESWIVLAETARYRLNRYWFKGPKAGICETFAEVQGFPDNCSMSADGLVWVALAAPLNPAVDKLHTMPLLVRKIAGRLPAALQPQPKKVAWVMAFDLKGSLVHDYCWNDGEYSMSTGVCQVGNSVYVSSLHERGLLTFELT